MLWCALLLGGTTCIIVDVREMRKRSRKKEKGAIMGEREYTGLNGEERCQKSVLIGRVDMGGQITAKQ